MKEPEKAWWRHPLCWTNYCCTQLSRFKFFGSEQLHVSC